jgi:nucleotide-binding universal stress UspA family protein
MNILLPTDFSENALNAVRYVYSHFDRDKINVQLVHIIKEPHSTSGVLLRLESILKKDAEKDMQLLLELIEYEFGVKPTYVIKYGYLINIIERVASAFKADLIIMGTQGENNLTTKLMGSVTESVIRTSQIPTLAIPNVSLNADIQEIVIATNKKEFDNQELIENIFNGLKWTNTRINVLTILQKNTASVPKSIALNGLQIGVKTVENESVVDGINVYLENNRVDLLALYHNRNSVLDYLFNRSITKTICAKIQIPILAIPSPR